MAYNSKYDDIESIFEKKSREPANADPGKNFSEASTINRALGGRAESSRGSRSDGHSFSGILQEEQVLDGISSAIDSETSLFRFGGLLFRGKNSHNGDVVAHAVEDMTQGEARNLVSDRYFDLTTDHGDLFLTYDRSMEINRHVVFTFRLPQGYKSLRELLNENKSPNCGEIIFRRLVALLARYEEVTRAAGTYRPLCCISLDTVFVNQTSNDIKVVPLVARHHDFPPYYPGEAGEEIADLRTDLYTAALTALQFMSGIEMETNDTEMADCSAIPAMDDCLRVFQSRRPDIRTVQAQLKQNTEAENGAFRFDSGKFVDIDGGWKNTEQKTMSLGEYIRKHSRRKKRETATFSGILHNED